jgi:hypothetical protein
MKYINLYGSQWSVGKAFNVKTFRRCQITRLLQNNIIPMIRYYNYYQHIHQCQLLIGVYTTEYTALSGFIPLKFHITTMLAENSLNNHFFPLAKTSSRVLFLLLLTSHILRRRKKRTRIKIREKMAMVFDNKIAV